MSWLNWGKEAGDTAKGVMEGAGGLFKDIRTAITGEIPPEKQAEIEMGLNQLEGMVVEGQNRINESESNHASLFVAGWRPFIGWVCGVAVAVHFIINPILFLFGVTGLMIDMATLLTLLSTMLGLGGLRSFEKYVGVNHKH